MVVHYDCLETDDSVAKNNINMDKNKSPSRHLMYNYHSDKQQENHLIDSARQTIAQNEVNSMILII